jgi:uncharacterized protein involved in response to NO
LLILHVGYGWLVIGVAALGVATLDVSFPLDAAIHTLTVGAIGTMILAVMTRVTRGHTGHELSADAPTSVTYGLVMLAAVVRISAEFAVGRRETLLVISAALWIGAFALFALRYAPLFIRPRASS